MVLLLTMIDKDKQWRDFVCMAAEMEDALDIASEIATHTAYILEASLIEDGKIIKLLPELFDGKPFSSPMQQLEAQWRQVLS
jgi:hypothetical protein